MECGGLPGFYPSVQSAVPTETSRTRHPRWGRNPRFLRSKTLCVGRTTRGVINYQTASSPGRRVFLFNDRLPERLTRARDGADACSRMEHARTYFECLRLWDLLPERRLRLSFRMVIEGRTERSGTVAACSRFLEQETLLLARLTG